MGLTVVVLGRSAESINIYFTFMKTF